MTKTRLALPVLAAAAALVLLAGCGGGSDGGSSTDTATLAPPESSLFVEATIRPSGSVKTNIDALAEKIAGVDDLGGLIASELEESARDEGEQLDFDKEIEPWLGDTAGIAFTEFDGDDFTGFSAAIPTTDADATQAFIDRQAKSDEGPAEDGSYEGVDYKIERDDGMTIGVVGEFLVIAEDEDAFKAAVDASDGNSLADDSDYGDATSSPPGGSAASVYVDVGLLIEQQGDGEIDPQALEIFKAAGIEPHEAIAFASLIPGSDQIEIDVSSDFASEQVQSGDASELLGSMPADSFAALASPDFGEGLKKAIDTIDEQGIPGQLAPHQLKSTVSESGFDLDKIAGSLGDLAVFAQGSSASTLGGAVVVTTSGESEAAKAISALGLLLRASDEPGITAISGKASGFSVRTEDIGPKPLVVVTKDERIAIGYGLPATMRGLSSDSGPTLSEDSTYKEAVSALGGTPISGFVDGPAALNLATGLGAAAEEGYRDARPYLAKASFLAIGNSVDGDSATAKLILGLKK